MGNYLPKQRKEITGDPSRHWVFWIISTKQGVLLGFSGGVDPWNPLPLRMNSEILCTEIFEMNFLDRHPSFAWGPSKRRRSMKIRWYFLCYSCPALPAPPWLSNSDKWHWNIPRDDDSRVGNRFLPLCAQFSLPQMQKTQQCNHTMP